MFAWCCCCRGKGTQVDNLADQNIRILILGLDNAGKTCATRSLVGDAAANMSSSVQAPTNCCSRVETKFQKFGVTILDLGGSKGFRSVWHKYFHEVHGIIFVVDSGDRKRSSECHDAFRDVLCHDKVRGKPILVLCNKDDVDGAMDEVQIVDALNVKQLVVSAKCPTRVDRCVANKNQGLKLGYKWLMNSIVSRIAELDPRIESDMESERQNEARRKAQEIRKAEERRRKKRKDEVVVEEALPPAVPAAMGAVEKVKEGTRGNDHSLQGSVPLSELKKKWHEEDKCARKSPLPEKKQKSFPHPALALPTLISLPSTCNEDDSTNDSARSEDIVEEGMESTSTVKEASKLETTKSNGHSNTNVRLPKIQEMMTFPTEKSSLDLEPISQPKKRSLLFKLNRTKPMLGRDFKLGPSRNGSSAAENYRISQVIKVYTAMAYN